MNGRKLQIVLVDDHAVVRGGLRLLLAQAGDMEVVGEAEDAEQAIQLIRQSEFDVALVDIGLPGKGGLDLLKQIKSERPRIAVLMLSMYAEEVYAVRALKAGASGYLTKNSEPAELLDAIHDVAAGRRVLSPDVAQALAGAALDGEALLSRLTPREFDVLRLAASGESPCAIASSMHLSQKTIHNHMSAIRQKLDADNDFKLLRLAARYGLIDWSASPA